MTANTPKEEGTSHQSQETAESATVSSRGFTSTHNSSFTSTKHKQNLSKHNISGFKNTFKGAKNQKHKSKPSGKKIKSPHKNDKIKQKNETTPEKTPLPEVTVVRSFNTAETEMEPSVHSPKKYVLFVGNLPYSVTKEQVEEHFKKTGIYHIDLK